MAVMTALVAPARGAAESIVAAALGVAGLRAVGI